MRAWLRSWWKNTSKTLKIVQIIVLALGVAFIVLLIGGYFFNWTWTGFGPYTPPTSDFQREKTLYDWLQLAIIPVALAFGVWWVNRLQQQRDQRLADQRAQTEREAAEKRAQTERDIAEDNQREAALKEYYNKMSELLLHENLRKSDPDAEVRNIASVWTLTVLPRLDPVRKASVLQFLYRSDLINKGMKIIDLLEADLSKANLFWANLRQANMSGVYLSEANLIGANLSEANLSEAILSKAKLFKADLGKANLGKANLIGAKLSKASLTEASLFKADLFEADLSKAKLIKANISGVNLIKANLSGANLSEADLREAVLVNADLSGADLSRANLCDALVDIEQLNKASSLKGATMPDGKKTRLTAPNVNRESTTHYRSP